MARVCFTRDGETVTALEGATVAAVVLGRNSSSRRSIAGEPRHPLCAMGTTCYECRVTVDGVPHVRACRVCREGLVVETRR